MAMKYDNYQEVIDKAYTTPERSLPNIEEQHYQVNHATIGYYVASSWRLPKDVCQIILQHHERDYLATITDPVKQDLYAVLKLAENIISVKYLERSSADWGYIETEVLKVLGISQSELPGLIKQTNDDISS